MFKTESLLAFVEVAKQGSFTAAAHARNQTPMAMSKQISRLESVLGEPLFERSTRNLRLTEFGESFFGQVKNILAKHDALDQWLEQRAGKLSGDLRVVCQAAMTLEETVFPFLTEFCNLYPALELSFDIQEKIIDIEKDPFDIYWGIGDYLGLRFPNMKRRLMWQAKYGIFAAPSYLAKYGIPKHPQELSNHRMISYLHDQPDNMLVVNQSPISQSTVIETTTIPAPIKTVTGHSALAAAGLGLINAVTDNGDIIRCLASGKLLPVLEDYWYSNVNAYIYYHQVKYEQPKVRAFIDFFLSKKHKW